MKCPHFLTIEFYDENLIPVAPVKKRKELIALIVSLVLLFTTSVWAAGGIVSYAAAQKELKLGKTYDVELHDVHGTTEQIITSRALEGGATTPAPVNINGTLNKTVQKHLFIKNADTSEGAIFVRLQLTEKFNDFDGHIPLKTALFTSTTAAGVMDAATIQWTLGSTIQSLASWNGTSYGDFWLMDPSTGYAYWMNPLAPGERTQDFLSSFVAKKSTEGGYRYSIQVIGDAISATEAADREQWGHDSTYDSKLDQLFTLYQDLVTP